LATRRGGTPRKKSTATSCPIPRVSQGTAGNADGRTVRLPIFTFVDTGAWHRRRKLKPRRRETCGRWRRGRAGHRYCDWRGGSDYAIAVGNRVLMMEYSVRSSPRGAPPFSGATGQRAAAAERSNTATDIPRPSASLTSSPNP
jgi:hypothetical protein